MNSLLRSEFFRISHSGLLLPLTIVIIVLNVFFSSRSSVNGVNLYDLPELSSVSVFLSYCDAHDMDVNSAKKMMIKMGYFTSSNADTLIGVYEDMQPHQFKIALHNLKGMLLLPILLLYIFIIRDFRNKSFYNSLYSGRSRTSVYFSKAVMFLIVAFVISLINILLLALFYANTIFGRLPATYVWSCCLLYALLETAILTVGFMLAFVLRKPLFSVFAVLVYSVIVSFTPSVVWPAEMQGNIDLWSRSASSGLVGTAVLSSAVFIGVSLLIGWFAFEKAELK